jgi:ubiquinone/menaquinone biosynthesis C-methylase UbiE
VIGPDVYVSGAYVEHFQPDIAANPFRDLYAAKRSDVLAAVELCLPTGASVLDLGGGPGRIAVPLARRYRVTLADVSSDMLAMAADRAARTGVRLEVQRADAADPLPFATGSFDAGLCIDLVAHLPRAAATLAEVRRVLAPGGVLLVDASNRAPWWILRYPRALGRRPGDWWATWRAGGVRPEWQATVRHHRLADFMELVKTAGFDFEREWRYGPRWCPKWVLTQWRRA